MYNCRQLRGAVIVVWFCSSGILCGGDRSSREKDQDALQPLQWIVGQWDGVGQPRRGSTRGAWQEASTWTWNFDESRATIRFRTNKGKYLRAGTLRPLAEPGKFELLATPPGHEKPLRFSGALESQPAGTAARLVLSSAEPSAGQPARVTIRQAAGGDRLLLLYERKTAGNRFTRLAEVGYTRQGSGFGRGTSFVECVVTGGLGTIPVTYQGKTYYVCCSGCRDYFNENPAAVLEERAE